MSDQLVNIDGKNGIYSGYYDYIYPIGQGPIPVKPVHCYSMFDGSNITLDYALPGIKPFRTSEIHLTMQEDIKHLENALVSLHKVQEGPIKAELTAPISIITAILAGLTDKTDMEVFARTSMRAIQEQYTIPAL